MKKKQTLFLCTGIAAAGAAAISAVSYAITNTMVKLALDRKQPEALEKHTKSQLSVSREDPALKLAAEASKTLEASGCETVEITSYDGLHLVGHWKECPGAKRIIVAMHGWRSSWSRDFGMIAPFYEANGCSVLFAEQRGQNNSGGDYMGFGMLERYDCKAWIDWVNARTGGTLPVYLAGISMGASTVLMTAGFDLPENVRGIMADCGFTSAHAIWKHVVQGLHLGYTGIRGAAANDLCRRKINMGSREYTTLHAMEQEKVPILFFHGTDDKFVPIEMTYENYKACKAPKRLLVVPGAEHGMSFHVDRPAYEKAVLDFWADYDNA